MPDPADPIVLPAKIHGYLVDLLELRFTGRREAAQAAIEALPESLPAGTVARLASRGPFGWLIDARLDQLDGRLALEALEDDRMSGPSHYRVWEDGTKEELETEHTTMVLPANCSPDEAQRVKDRFFAHNRAVQEQLTQRGFIGGG